MDKQKIYNSLSRQGVTSTMNSTKWRRLLYLLGELSIAYRVKVLDWPEVSDWHNYYVRDVPANYFELTSVGPILFLQIQWLEVKPLNDKDEKIAAQIEERINRIHAPRSRNGSTFRIWGHLLQSDIHNAQ